jgi:pimeloyl-ACP methyl ester carboxylesterase
MESRHLWPWSDARLFSWNDGQFGQPLPQLAIDCEESSAHSHFFLERTPARRRNTVADKTLSAEERQRIEKFLKRTGPPKIEAPFNRLTPRIQKMRLWALAQPQHYASNNDNSFFEAYTGEEYAEMFSARKAEDYPLGDLPLIVLTRGKSELPDTEEGRQDNEERKREQLDLLRLSHNSKQIIAEASGHDIQLEDPALVIDAIREVVDAILRHRKLMPPR